MSYLKKFTEDDQFESDIDSKLDEITEEASKRKLEILDERLKELGIVLDFKKEELRRFKSLTSNNVGNKTHIYYNDGSINGLRVITFEDTMTTSTSEDGITQYNLETSYY